MNGVLLIVFCLTLAESLIYQSCSRYNYIRLSIEAKVHPQSTCENKKITLIYTSSGSSNNVCLMQNHEINPCWPNGSCWKYQDRLKNFQCFKECHNRQECQEFQNGTTIVSMPIDFARHKIWEFRVSRPRSGTHACVISLNASFFNNCLSTSLSTTTEAAVLFQTTETQTLTTGGRKTETLSPVYAVVITINVLLVLLVALLCFAKKKFQQHIERKAKFYEVAIAPKIPITIFLLFLEEHPNHKAIVLRFATYMRERLGFKIILELYNREEIYENPASWLEKSLSNSDVVLVIWSPGAVERWHNPEKFTNRLDLFTPCLKRIKNEMSLHKNLSKYMFAYFEYFDNDIPKFIQSSSIFCMQLMEDFNSFCRKLIECKRNSETLSEKPKLIYEKTYSTAIQKQAVDLEKRIFEMHCLKKNKTAWVDLESN